MLMESTLDVMFYLYLFVGGTIVGGITILVTKAVNYLTAKTKNETYDGVIRRVGASILDAVAMVDQTLKKEIIKAKRPDSPGGTKIIAKERSDMLNEVYQCLKSEYGGIQGILKLFKTIGIQDEGAVKRKVDTMIEAAVNLHEIRKR